MKLLHSIAFLAGLAFAPCAFAQQGSTSKPPPRDVTVQQDGEDAEPAKPKNALDGFLRWMKENAEPPNGGVAGDTGVGDRKGGGDRGGDGGH